MSLASRRLSPRLQDWRVVLDAVLVGAVSLLVISHLLSDLNLSPDSSSYITASRNFARTGRLFVYVNSPSRSMLPEIEPYSEQPPGLPLYLVPFMILLGDPIRAAVAGQALAITGLFSFAYLLMAQLGISLPLRFLGLLAFLLLDGFRYIHIDPTTEALFICLALGIGWIALRYYRGGREKWVWPTLTVLIAFSASVRYTGIANLAWILPSLSGRETFRRLPRLFTHRYVALSLAAGGSALVALSLLADALGLSKNPGIGPVQTWGIAVGSAVMAIALGIWLTARRRWAGAGSEPSDDDLPPEVVWPIAATLAAFAAVGLWLLRNQLTVGNPTRTGEFDAFMPENLAIPFEFIASSLLDLRLVPTGVAALTVVALAGLPLGLARHEAKRAHLLLGAACSAHFVAVALASTVVRISELHFRLLSPVISLGIIVLLSGLQAGIGDGRASSWRKALILLPVGYLGLSNATSLELLRPAGFSIHYPAERQLWREIRRLDFAEQASHYYTDGIFEHQIFVDLPQRIFWDPETLEDASEVNRLLASGSHPFILFQDWTPEARALEEHIRRGSVELEKLEFREAGYFLYHPPG